MTALRYLRAIVRFVFLGTPRCIQCKHFHLHRNTGRVRCRAIEPCGRIGLSFQKRTKGDPA